MSLNLNQRFLSLALLAGFSILVTVTLKAEAADDASRRQAVNDALDQFEGQNPSEAKPSMAPVNDYHPPNTRGRGMQSDWPSRTTSTNTPRESGEKTRNYRNWVSHAASLEYERQRKRHNENSDSEQPFNEWILSQDEHYSQEPSSFTPLYEFFKNLNYGVIVENDRKASYFFETIFPLSQTTDKVETFFMHDRVSTQGDSTTFSAGLGYRQLLFKNTALAGINTFFDYKTPEKHYRSSLGLEYFSKNSEARFNYYAGLSPQRRVKTIGQFIQMEKVVNGFDMEVGGKVPVLPWLKLYTGYSVYDFARKKDISGWTSRAEVKPMKYLTFNLSRFDDAFNSDQIRLESRFSMSIDSMNILDWFRDMKSSEKKNKNDSDKYDVSYMTLNRVERDFNIVVEKWEDFQGPAPLPVGSGGDIQVQLIWPQSNNSDLDIHLISPAGTPAEVYFAATQSFIGTTLFAELDVDDIPLSGAHASHSGRDHVENIFVVNGQAVAGTYQVFARAFNHVSDVTATINVFVDGVFKSQSTHTFTADSENFSIPDIAYP